MRVRLCTRINPGKSISLLIKSELEGPCKSPNLACVLFFITVDWDSLIFLHRHHFRLPLQLVQSWIIQWSSRLVRHDIQVDYALDHFFFIYWMFAYEGQASEQYQIHKSLTTQMNWNFLILFHRKILLWCMPCWQILWTRRCRCYLQLLLSVWWQYPLNTFWIVAEHTCISAGASFCKSCAPGSYSEAAGTAAFEINITHTSAAYLLQLSVFAFRNNI